MDRFSQILYDLSQEIGGGLSLHIDENRVCQLNFADELHIQLSYEEGKDRLLMASFLCDVPPGKYREKLFKATLIANVEFPRLGTFGYCTRNNKLTFFEYLPSEKATGPKVFSLLEGFIEKGLKWKNAIEGGKPLPIVTSKTQKDDDSIFGLKP